MITLKDWNSFTHNTRRRLLEVIMSPFEADNYCEPFHHNFDYSEHGKKLKKILEHFVKQKDGSIKVSINITPQYETKPKDFAESIEKVFNATHNEVVSHCEYCGKPLSRSDVNDYGSLCEECYLKEYYNNETIH